MKAPFTMTLQAAADACSGRVAAGDGNLRLSEICSDSRESGSGSLFAAIRGDRFDGHDFAKNLMEQKAVGAVLAEEQSLKEAAEKNGTGLVICSDTVRALGLIAGAYRKSVNPMVVAVTGTNGKTTAKELIAAVLQSKFKTHKSEKNYNNEIGVPFAVFGLKPEHEAAVFELGMNHPGEIERLSQAVQPHIALITSIGEGHLEFLGSIENTALAKMEIIRPMRQGSLLVLNRDTACFDMMRGLAADAGINVKTFGLNENADVFPASVNATSCETEIICSGGRLAVPLYGIHNAYNLLAAVAVAEEFGISSAEAGEALADFKLVEGRSRIIERDFIVIDDTYNSNPLSSRYAIKSLKQIFTGRRKIAVLSDMKELGEASSAYHREIGRLAAVEDIDLLCVWGDMAEDYIEGAAMEGANRIRVIGFNSKLELIDFLKKNVTKGDAVLIKGSRAMKMEEVVSSLVSL